MTPPMVSIVVPAFNAARTLGACLDACLAQDYPAFEVIAVDDGSADATAEAVRARPAVRLVQQPNAGPAAARNRGAAEARGAFVAYTDSDCVPRADWLSRLMDRIEDGAAAGGTYDIANPQSRLARLIQAEIAARHAQMHDTPDGVDFLGTFNVMYRKAAFEAIGGFDAAFRRASGEDNDVSYRLIAAGNTLRFTRDAVVAHHHPERLWPYLRTQARHGYWRAVLYAKRPARARGDRYAPLGEMLLSPLACACAAAALTCETLALAVPTPLLRLPLALWAAYFALRAGVNVGLAPGLRFADQAAFFGMTVLRDLARGIGLAGGLVRVLRGGGAP